MYRAPVSLPSEAPALAQATQQEFAKVERESISAQDFVRMKVLHVEPTRVYGGMVILADGVDLDPSSLGTGQGLYRRLEDNSAWVFIG